MVRLQESGEMYLETDAGGFLVLKKKEQEKRIPCPDRLF